MSILRLRNDITSLGRKKSIGVITLVCSVEVELGTKWATGSEIDIEEFIQGKG